jgi:hypothetical protein
MFGLDVYSDIQISVQPVLNATGAAAAARAGVDHITSVNVNNDLKILPVPRRKGNVYRLVYEVKVDTWEDGIPSSYYTLVDADNGNVLYRQNRVRHFANTDITASGTIYPTHVYNATQYLPMPYVKMVIGGMPYNADVNGTFQITTASPVSATFSLEGPWARIYTGASGSTVTSFTQTINPGINAVDFDVNTTIRHLTAYYHTNVIHDYLNLQIPTFSGLDNPMIVKVDRTDGTCNAFYDGNLNFYTTAGGCHALSQVADVVYHEYGHAITHSYWGANGLSFDNGAMGEGYADVWAISITENPVLGIGFDVVDPTISIRNYDFNNSVPRKVYPQDIVGEVHADGEIIAGAWYSTALNMGSVATMASLFAESHAGLANGPDGAEGQVYTDILIDALLADDNDADITNGTPNGTAITSAFAAHGITLLSNATLTHAPVLTSAPNNAITLNATLGTTPFFWAFSEIRGAYKTSLTGTWTPFSLINTGGNNYSTTIPGQPAGTIISYYLGIEDTYGNFSNVQPTSADLSNDPNIPYYIMVGFNLLFTDDFDFNAGLWITGLPGDDAVTGQWEQNQPQQTLLGSMPVQPGYQNTPGGQFCYVTQADPGSGLGSYDVDDGKTTIQSPDLDLSTYVNPAIEYFRWYSNDQGATPGTDYWQVYISNDGVNYVPVEYTQTADHSWRRFVFLVSDYVQPNSTVSVRFVAEDANDGSLIEALMDDFSVYETASSGINEDVSLITAGLSPNPANDFVQLTCVHAASKDYQLKITDALGREVYSNPVSFQQGINTMNIPVNTFSNGIYQLNLVHKNSNKVMRFAVTR